LKTHLDSQRHFGNFARSDSGRELYILCALLHKTPSEISGVDYIEKQFLLFAYEEDMRLTYGR
jgi:hypothetical protein